MNTIIRSNSACPKADLKFYGNSQAGRKTCRRGVEMKKCLWTFVALIACSATSLGQTNRANNLSAGQVLDELMSNAEKEIVPAADAMPEDKYAFAPTNGEFKGVRSFAGQVKHLSAANYQLAARILGEKPPHDEQNETAPDSVQSKEQIVEYLKGSFAYLHTAVASINDKSLSDPIAGTKGTWQRSRIGLATDAVAHSYDHYGQMVEYLRMNGIVPPASR